MLACFRHESKLAPFHPDWKRTDQGSQRYSISRAGQEEEEEEEEEEQEQEQKQKQEQEQQEREGGLITKIALIVAPIPIMIIDQKLKTDNIPSGSKLSTNA